MRKLAGAGACSVFFCRIAAPLNTAFQSLGEEGSSHLPEGPVLPHPLRSSEDMKLQDLDLLRQLHAGQC